MAKKAMSKKKKKPAAAKRGAPQKTKRKVAKTKKLTKAKKATKAKKVASKRKKKVGHIPRGYNSITPYLIVDNAAEAILFYKKIFAAKEITRMEHGDKIGHAELKIGDAKIMLADEYPEMNVRAPKEYGGSPVSLYLYIKDVDTIVDNAVAAGAKLVRPVENMFYGDRSGTIEDPFGHIWYVATHVEEIKPAILKKRAEEIYNKK